MTTTFDDEEIDRQLYTEFLDEVRDTVGALQVLLENLRSRSIQPREALATLRRSVHNLKTLGHAVQSPTVKMVTHRLDEYVGDLSDLTPQQISDIQAFIDKLQAVVDGEAVTEESVNEVVRALPSRQAVEVDFGPIEQKNIEILLIVPEKAMSTILARELAACGYRVSAVHDPFDAFETVVHTQPDLVIASMELGALSGIDLACAFNAMPKTQTIPFALLTSYDWGHPKLANLPPRAALINKGAKFGDDLAETLARFRIT